MSILVETCPKCGADLMDIVLASYPPIPQKRCMCCGWSWTGKAEKIVRRPFNEDAEISDCKKRSNFD